MAGADALRHVRTPGEKQASRARWHIPVVPPTQRSRQGDSLKFRTPIV